MQLILIYSYRPKLAKGVINSVLWVAPFIESLVNAKNLFISSWRNNFFLMVKIKANKTKP